MKRTKFKVDTDELEQKIAWWNEISAGVGLIVGYMIYVGYILFTPSTIVEIDINEPLYTNKVIGQIPENHILVDVDTNLDKYTDIVKSVPVFNDDGSPKLSTSSIKYEGFGQAKVETIKVEILIPRLTKEKYQKVRVNKGNQEYHIYEPIIYLKGTGIFYEKKAVIFEDDLNAEVFAIRTATFFALLSFLLFLLKIRHKIIRSILHSLDFLFNVKNNHHVVSKKYEKLLEVATEYCQSEEYALEFIFTPIKDFDNMAPVDFVDKGLEFFIIDILQIKKKGSNLSLNESDDMVDKWIESGYLEAYQDENGEEKFRVSKQIRYLEERDDS
jgi:hypothetical protein